ncbi:MAG: PH domain-containing protein [Bacilli bacterium]|nr:PH domain-containing protein [Bacilli bacterium]
MEKNVYKLADDFLSKYSFTIAWRIKQHAKIMEKHLNSDEEIFYLFAAQKNPNPFDIFSTCLVALTNKRIMVAQKRVIFGYNLKSVTPDLFNDFSVYKGIIFGKVYIDTVKEFIALSNIDPKALPEIETNLSEYLLRIKEKYGKKNYTEAEETTLSYSFDQEEEKPYKDE